ncbi:hypothetical protein JCM8115_001451 [Rhodotorula mucilaginosa]|nr:hypothetical protein B0A53_01712 [Rhodotorula sp. CCFEE 5036]
MFGRPANPYDEVVAKATDEKQTEINWEIALTVWDKVNEDGETGARNCIAALQKRLTHRSANVQLFSLTLAGALVSNCGPPLHREISGKAFTSALTRLVNDRSTHETVKKEALKQIETWVKEHQGNSDFDLMADTYEALKRQGHAFQPVRPPTPKGPSDDILRREEEDLQRALAESAALADPVRNASSPATATAIDRAPPQPERNLPSHARAMYDFAGESSDELSFARGELIRVIDAVSDEWWRGELRGRTGIFPTNYVEPASAPSAVTSEAPRSVAGPSSEDMEGEVFAQAAAIDRLLSLMHTLRARGEDFADNEELTDLYNSSMALRPKVVQLIRKYDQKQAELRAMNDKVEQAKATFERNAALAHQHQQQAHAAHYQQQPPYQQQPNGYGAPQPAQYGQPAMDAYGRQYSPAPNPAAGYASPVPMAQSPAPAGQPLQQNPADAAREEELKREYERQLVEYQRQLEEYNRQVAAIQAQQQAAAGAPQGGQVPPPSAAAPAGGDQGSSPNVMTASHPPAGPSADAQQAPHAGQPQGQPQPVWDAQTNQWVWPHLQANVTAPPATSPLNAPGQPYPPPQQAAAQPVPVEQMANLSVTSSPPPMQPAAAAPYAQQQPYPTGATSPLPPPPASSGPQGHHPAASPGLAHAAPSYAGYPGAPSPAQPYQYSQPGYAQPYPSQA